jgi:BirA family biotin operon repressor/biotin-[acetyl-CoA-carboxylase] ligase
MIDKLDKQLILQSLEDGLFTGGVHLFDTLDSTNDWSLAEIERGRALPFVCIADHQRKGRGRRGRHWVSPSNANIYLSLVWHFESAGQGLGLLSLAQGVAVIRTLNQIGITDAWLKWPNDVLIKNNKIAGILIETRVLPGGRCRAVIGVGLNYCMPETIAAESEMRWTDVVHAIDSAAPDRNVVVAVLINEVVTMCRQYQHSASTLLDELELALAALTGKEVRVSTEAGDRVTGKVLGIYATGELRVQVNGREHCFSSADVSLGSGFEADTTDADD